MHTTDTTVLDTSVINVSRRDLLKGGAAALSLAVVAHGAGAADAPLPSGVPPLPFTPGPFLSLGTDGTVTVIARNTEMGQGAYTGLATLVAEELGADWAQVRVEGAPADAKRYGNPVFGGMQGTGGSTSIASAWQQYRQAGATARAMLAAAAAQRWSVPAAEIGVSRGVVSHGASGRSARFGELVALAATLPVPEKAPLKDAKSFELIGKPRPRVDSVAKSTGKAQFTQDVQLPDMLVAVVALPPKYGAKVKSVDSTRAKGMPGVTAVVQFRTPVREGVAVLAKDTWSAKQARDALKVEWDESAAMKLGSAEIFAEYRRLAATPGTVARKEGDVAAALAGAARTLEAEYEFPFLAHAAMEPMNCVVQLREGGCEIWNGEQFQSVHQPLAAQMLGIPADRVKINMLYAGGSFGRRGNPHGDYVADGVAIAKAWYETSGRRQPVKLVWMREDDTRAGYYRPAYLHAFKAGLDAHGNIVAWQHRIVGQSLMAGTVLDPKLPIDPTSVEGASNLPYAIANLQVELHTTKIGVPVLFWRSVGSTHTAYATECFLDDIARATGKDPLALRRSLLAKHPRHLAVLNLAAEKAGWSRPAGAGISRGIAVHESFNTFVAQVAEVRRADSGFKVERVVCAVDCGTAVNPNIVAMQMESGIGYGLSAAMSGAITLEGGTVKQSNFHDYPVLRMNQMPKVEVHIVPSTAAPTGVGEPATPVIGPAVANALAALTGKPARKLPFASEGMSFG